MKPYCVYLTIYRGNKMPPFYIGSTSVDKILNKKYYGSVSSKKWKDIWWSEIKNNPHLFTVRIVCTYNTKQESLDKEYKLQMALNIMKKPEMYINRAVAAKNGYFGRDVFGKNNPNYGKSPTKESRIRQSIRMMGENNPRFGVSSSAETRKKLSVANIGKNVGPKNYFHGKTGELAYNHNKIWINNGVINRYHPSDDIIPEGWYKGMISKKKS